MAGTREEGKAPRVLDPIDWDVEAAFEPDFDFAALFAADEVEVAEVAPKVDIPRRRLAFAASITLAALPLLFLDNFQANASTPDKVESRDEQAGSASSEAPTVPERLATTEVPAMPLVTTPVAVVFNAVAEVTTTIPAEPTTTEAPTTTAKPHFVAAVAPTTTKAPTTTAAPAPTTTAAPAVRTTGAPDPAADATWERLAKCESNGNWSANTGNGYYGGLQFSLATWRSLGGEGYPHQTSKATQIAMGKKLYARSGWSAWPTCTRKLGWR